MQPVRWARTPLRTIDGRQGRPGHDLGDEMSDCQIAARLSTCVALVSATNRAPIGAMPGPDRTVHGGPDKAVYAYAIEDTEWWETELERPLAPRRESPRRRTGFVADVVERVGGELGDIARRSAGGLTRDDGAALPDTVVDVVYQLTCRSSLRSAAIRSKSVTSVRRRSPWRPIGPTSCCSSRSRSDRQLTASSATAECNSWAR